MLQKDKWSGLQKDGYHPDVDTSIKRIKDDIENSENPKNNLFKEWSGILGMDITCRDKAVLEIGHGGGWYMAQCLAKGASIVVGMEISDLINDKARSAFSHFGYKNFKLYEADESCLEVVEEKIDIIYSITVFQHIHPALTKKYLQTAKGILNPEGIFLCQFLMNDHNSTKNWLSGEGAVRYSQDELISVFSELGIVILTQGNLKYPNNYQDYWGIYALQFSRA